MKISKLAASCCAPLLSGPLSSEDAEQLAALFRVLGEPARLPTGEVCACELSTPLRLSQPTLSHHLKVMYEAGLLHKERRGTWIYYRLAPERFEVLRRVLAIP
jgi:ArsR family transcriptional regulator, arsenate/arsenite/antimonite-responsive transcriptional repressor